LPSVQGEPPKAVPRRRLSIPAVDRPRRWELHRRCGADPRVRRRCPRRRFESEHPARDRLDV